MRSQLHSEVAKGADGKRPVFLSDGCRILPGEGPDGKGHAAGSGVGGTGRSEAKTHRGVSPGVDIGTGRLDRGPPGSWAQHLERDPVDDTADVTDAHLAFCFRTRLDSENAGAEGYCDSEPIVGRTALVVIPLLGLRCVCPLEERPAVAAEG